MLKLPSPTGWAVIPCRLSKRRRFKGRVTIHVRRKMTNKESTRHQHVIIIHETHRSSLFSKIFLFLIIPCRLRSCQDENHHHRFLFFYINFYLSSSVDEAIFFFERGPNIKAICFDIHYHNHTI